MSSSFVKDCSNASGSSSGNKTFIIIVSNETGNLNLNENQLQSLLGEYFYCTDYYYYYHHYLPTW